MILCASVTLSYYSIVVMCNLPLTLQSVNVPHVTFQAFPPHTYTVHVSCYQGTCISITTHGVLLVNKQGVMGIGPLEEYTVIADYQLKTLSILYF